MKDIASYKYRCRSRGCHRRIERLHGHPIFITGRNSLSIFHQYLILEAWLHGVPSAAIHLNYNISHGTIENITRRIRAHIANWVRAEQDKIVYFDGPEVPEIEVDECTFSKRQTLDREKPISWQGYVGIIRRGYPRSLKLIALGMAAAALQRGGWGLRL